MSKNDGGPAFPGQWDHGQGQIESWEGITMRDWFAGKADQPGVQEIVTAAGFFCRDSCNVWRDGDTRIGTFTEWWATLTNEARFALAAKVRFQYADAMLAERAKDQP